MRRIAAVLIVLTLVLVTLLVVRLRRQEAALRGPATGSGEIEGTTLALAAKISARVVRVAAQEGRPVKQGELLVALDCAEPQASLQEAEAKLASAQAQARAALATAEGAAGSQKAALAAIEANRAQAASLSTQRDAARRQAERLNAVAGDVAFSNRDQANTSAAALEQQLKAAEASSEASSAQARAASGQARAAMSQAEAAEAGVRAAESAIARAKLLVAECEVRAPRDAMVETLPFEPGELVAPGAVLARLLDLREVKAIFYLPNAEIAHVRPGSAARVAADAFPGEVFEGTVKTVSFEAEFTPRNIQTRTDRDRLVYPIEVTVANPELKLRAGMPVEVTLPGSQAAK